MADSRASPKTTKTAVKHHQDFTRERGLGLNPEGNGHL